jgi:predicted DNA-binding transcriptional regulator AlpA
MRNPPAGPAAGKISVVTGMSGVSPATIRRRSQDDPGFPKPLRLTAEGDLMWLLANIQAYLERKAGRLIAA